MISDVIEITVTGPVQSGKSAVLQSIHDMLSGYGYAVVYPDRAMRNNPPDAIDKAEAHEKPDVDSVVFVLHEAVDGASHG